MYKSFFKRILDVILSAGALVVFSPIIIYTAYLVKNRLGSPVLFTQDRPGKNGVIFKLYKFRSMTDARDNEGKLLPDEIRLTDFGKKLRSTSLDELPELINILKGDMSVVGPRPLLPRDVACMNAEQNRRHEVRPGLTGLAQCSGRNLLNWDIKLALDVEYVDKISFLLDMKIIYTTFIKVIKKDGVSFEEGADMDLKDWNEMKNRKAEE